MLTRGNAVPMLLRMTTGLRRAFAAILDRESSRLRAGSGQIRKSRPAGGGPSTEAKSSDPLKPERVQ